MKNRYFFFKRLYPEYIIAFDNGNGYNSLYWDKKLLEYLNKEDINYIMVDNENNIVMNSYSNNKYRYFVVKLFLLELVDKIGYSEER